MNGTDTIAAVATPPGVAAIAVIRISGPGVDAIAQRCFAARRGVLVPGKLARGWLKSADGQRLDDALAVRFAAPHSYTGEDVLELHVHGGTGVVGSALASVLAAGARLAPPGEFTRRAFLNGRLDLAQAEAVADLIAAETTQAAHAAAQRLSGEGSSRLAHLRTQLLDRIVEIEAHVDYPDEVPPPQEAAIATTIEAQLDEVARLLHEGAGAKALRDGIVCVIAGPPNAGKSSLLNALLQAERAIVSEIPGTTRDIVEDRATIDGVIVQLRDTAGLRDAVDAIEAEGVRRARGAIAAAELLMLVIDAAKPLDADDLACLEIAPETPRVVIANKLDLGETALGSLRAAIGTSNGRVQRFIAGSVLAQPTITQVRAAISELGWGGQLPHANRALVANARQLNALQRARESLEQARATLQERRPIDLIVGDLRAAVGAYGEVTGDDVTEEILSGIFSRFCVGK